jgi:DNA-binding SARP family transcriptional activator
MLYLKTQGYLIDYYKKHSRFEESIACGQKIIEMDPLREEIHRELMRLFMASGQRSLAIRQYELCKDLLRTELNVAPMPETRLLQRQIAGQGAYPSGHSLLDRVTNLKEAVKLLQSVLQTHEVMNEHIQKALEYLEEVSASSPSSHSLKDGNTPP